MMIIKAGDKVKIISTTYSNVDINAKHIIKEVLQSGVDVYVVLTDGTISKDALYFYFSEIEAGKNISIHKIISSILDILLPIGYMSLFLAGAIFSAHENHLMAIEFFTCAIFGRLLEGGKQ